jgi:hypothetical protein
VKWTLNNMLDKELVEKLIDSGWVGKNPQIEEVIDMCDGKLKEIIQDDRGKWLAIPYSKKDIDGAINVSGKTPEEIVVKFYLALKKHERLLGRASKKK